VDSATSSVERGKEGVARNPQIILDLVPVYEVRQRLVASLFLIAQ
jgi:hypothetical protein